MGFRSVEEPLMGLLVSIVAASLAFWLIESARTVAVGPAGLVPPG